MPHTLATNHTSISFIYHSQLAYLHCRVLFRSGMYVAQRSVRSVVLIEL